MQVERTTADGRAGGTAAARKTAVRETADTCIGLISSHAILSVRLKDQLS